MFNTKNLIYLQGIFSACPIIRTYDGSIAAIAQVSYKTSSTTPIGPYGTREPR